jgi:hypothetical protein
MPCGHVAEGNSERKVGGFTSVAYGSTSRADETDRTCDPPILPGKTGFFDRLKSALGRFLFARFYVAALRLASRSVEGWLIA